MRLGHPCEGLRRAVRRRQRRSARHSESGQATTEFALILIPLLIVVGGIIYFGIGLNYWLDMNRVANQGARWAAVNNWPRYCPRTDNPNLLTTGVGLQQRRRPWLRHAQQCSGRPSPFHTRARLQDVMLMSDAEPVDVPQLCATRA